MSYQTCFIRDALVFLEPGVGYVYVLAAEFNALIVRPERYSHDEYDSFLHSLWQGIRIEKPKYSSITEKEMLRNLISHPELVENCVHEGMTAFISVMFCLEDVFGMRLILYRDDDGALEGPEAGEKPEIKLIRLEGKWFFIESIQFHDRDHHALRYHEQMYRP